MKTTILALLSLILVAGPAGAESPPELEREMQAAITAWDGSCSAKGRAGGLCLVEVRVAGVNHCTADYRTFKSRRSKAAAAAHRRLARAWKAFQGLEAGGQRSLAGLAARVRLRMADEAAERHLTARAPSGLDFDSSVEAIRAKSTKTYARWLAATRASLKSGMDGYRAASTLAGIGDPTRALARARGVFFIESAAEDLLKLEIPSDVRRGQYAEQMTAAYCDTLAEQAELLQQLAKRWKSAKP